MWRWLDARSDVTRGNLIGLLFLSSVSIWHGSNFLAGIRVIIGFVLMFRRGRHVGTRP